MYPERTTKKTAKRYYEMSKNKWTFTELLEKKPSLNHIKQRVFNNSYVVQFWDKPARTIIAHLYTKMVTSLYIRIINKNEQ